MCLFNCMALLGSSAFPTETAVMVNSAHSGDACTNPEVTDIPPRIKTLVM